EWYARELARKRDRKQKTDRQNAQHILQLLMENRFPKIWVPSGENRDLRQLLWHRHRMGQAPHHEPAAGSGSERRLTLQEEIVVGERTTTIRSLSVSPLGEPATGRSAAAVGSAEPDHQRSDASERAGSRERSGGAALADASWSGRTDGLSLRINHRKGGALSVREADRGVFGVSALGGFKRKSTTTGTYHEARSSILRFLLVEAAQVTARSIPEWRNKYVH